MTSFATTDAATQAMARTGDDAGRAACEWVSARPIEIAAACRAVGADPAEILGWVFDSVVLAEAKNELAVLTVERAVRRAIDARRAFERCAGVTRPTRGAHPLGVELDAAPDPAGGLDPLRRLSAAEEIAALAATSRWCGEAAREAANAPRGRQPDPDPRGEKTRQRKRARERAGQLIFSGWGWAA